jgi:tRNA threonylcarbamoyladenosine biosynthesis protein TsaB
VCANRSELPPDPLILAVEQSTSASSLALLRGTRCLHAYAWEEPLVRNQHLFTVLAQMFAQARLAPADVHLFAVGLGPGAFSGIRIALSAVRALALPAKRSVIGVASPEVLAWEIGRECRAPLVAIVGDARRSRLWVATYATTEARSVQQGPLALIPAAELPSKLLPGCVVASPDWERLQAVLTGALPDAATLLRAPRVPRAQALGVLALRKARERDPRLPLQPIYLHPPVTVPPRRTP